jgi:hypothetical protein
VGGGWLFAEYREQFPYCRPLTSVPYTYLFATQLTSQVASLGFSWKLHGPLQQNGPPSLPPNPIAANYNNSERLRMLRDELGFLSSPPHFSLPLPSCDVGNNGRRGTLARGWQRMARGPHSTQERRWTRGMKMFIPIYEREVKLSLCLTN